MFGFPEETGNARSIPGFSRTQQNRLSQVTIRILVKAQISRTKGAVYSIYPPQI